SRRDPYHGASGRCPHCRPVCHNGLKGADGTSTDCRQRTRTYRAPDYWGHFACGETVAGKAPAGCDTTTGLPPKGGLFDAPDRWREGCTEVSRDSTTSGRETAPDRFDRP